MDIRAKGVPSGWAGPIKSWVESLAIAGRSKATIYTRQDHVQRMARGLSVEPNKVSRSQLIEWLAAQNWSRETRRSAQQSIRQFWAWAASNGVVSASPAVGLPHVKAANPMPRPAPPIVVETGLMNADARTRLILLCAVDVGMRRSEIAQIHLDDIEPDLTGWSIIAHGKGNKDRRIPLPDDLAAELVRACRNGGGFAFPGNVDGHLSARYVGKLATRALPGIWTLHTLRHRCGTDVYQASGDIMAVRDLLGHSSVATTQRYIATDQDRLRAALSARRAAS
ncbi:hypothetical protein HMPREF9306_00230 [Propionimicrobium lymphophilum ACS-093-V-SCH5]|uniref:Tyr recombinase domain-containing protein n=2 Tax=Propionimicrobium TaxID=203133 RepID=S2W3T7_9ACTN|nr:hypothetical protein HMPREF9306_00230 [Propionimicrobium lymphophilum ACS-093-V-SCH5]